ncbi:hypothetical protein Tco_1387984, partial [Tanacetum coccineum]
GTPTPVSMWFFALNIAPAGEVNDRYGYGACSRLFENLVGVLFEKSCFDVWYGFLFLWTGVKIVWTPVWSFGCNNWQLCAVFLDETSLKVVLRLMIMPPRMKTRSAGRPVATSRGGGTGGRASRGGGRTGGRSGDQGDGRNEG